MPLFQVQGHYTILVQADSFEQADMKINDISDSKLFITTPNYRNGDDPYTCVGELTDIDVEIIQKRSDANR